MKLFNLRNLILLTLFCFPVLSHAVIVKGTFEGTVANASDYSDEDQGYVSFWNENPTSKKMSGRFQYDTNLAPTMWLQRENTASYFNNNVSQPNWLTLEFFIDGRWLNVSSNRSEASQIIETTKIVGIVDLDDPKLWVHGNYFSLVDLQVAENAEGNRESTYAYISIMDPLIDIIHGLELTQNFSWTKGSHANWGMGTYEVMGEKNGQPYWAGANLEISTLTISPQYSLVPEPSPFCLFAFMLVGLALRFLRK